MVASGLEIMAEGLGMVDVVAEGGVVDVVAGVAVAVADAAAASARVVELGFAERG